MKKDFNEDKILGDVREALNPIRKKGLLRLEKSIYLNVVSLLDDPSTNTKGYTVDELIKIATENHERRCEGTESSKKYKNPKSHKHRTSRIAL